MPPTGAVCRAGCLADAREFRVVVATAPVPLFAVVVAVALPESFHEREILDIPDTVIIVCPASLAMSMRGGASPTRVTVTPPGEIYA